MRVLPWASIIVFYGCTNTSSPPSAMENATPELQTPLAATALHSPSRSFTPAALTPVKIPTKLYRALQQEGGTVDAGVLDPETLLLLTTRRAWIYKILDKRARKISLPPPHPPKHLSILNPQQFMVLSPSRIHLLHVKDASKRIRSFDLNDDHIIAAGTYHSHPSVLTHRQLHIFNQDHRRIATITTPPLPHTPATTSVATSKKAPFPSYKALIAPHHIWLYSSRSLWCWQPPLSVISDPKSSTTSHPQPATTSSWQLVVKNLRAIQSISHYHHHLILHTPYAIIVMDKNHEIENTIPVSSNRSLAHFYLSHQKHYYIFDDRRIEIYDTAQKTYYFTALKTTQPQKTLPQLRFHPSLLLTLNQGTFDLYRWSFQSPPPAHTAARTSSNNSQQ